MSDTITVVLSDVEKREGSNDKGPWTKFSLKDGNGQVVGATFSRPIGDAAESLKGERVEINLEPARDPKFPPNVKAIKPAPEATPEQNGDAKMSKAEWRAKDRAADKRACIAIAAGSITHTLKAEPSDEDLKAFAERTVRLARWFFAEVTNEYLHAVEDAGKDPTDGAPF